LGFAILITLYTLLTLEIFHRTVIALIMAGVILIINLILRYASFTQLIEAIDLDTILLLMSMMMFVSIMSKTGVFSYLAHHILFRLYSRPFMLIAILTSLTAFVSAFVDNVTTVLIITPIVIEVSRRLRIDPRLILLAIVFSSNIGGTATLIGDPPNIIIGSLAHLGFMAFIYNLTPIVIVDFILFLLLIKIMYRGWLREYRATVSKLSNAISNLRINVKLYRRDLIEVLVPFFIVIILFTLEDVLKYPPAIPALIGSAILLVLMGKRINIEEVLRDIDWSTLVFFMAMFIVIKGIEKLGFMKFIADFILDFSTNFTVMILLVVWLSAIVSAFVDNIPFVMTMMSALLILSKSLSYNITPLYWALSLGGCLGGNATLVGASANIVVAGIADKYGYHISFKYFMKYGMPVMLLTVGVSSVYLVLRYT